MKQMTRLRVLALCTGISFVGATAVFFPHRADADRRAVYDITIATEREARMTAEEAATTALNKLSAPFSGLRVHAVPEVLSVTLTTGEEVGAHLPAHAGVDTLSWDLLWVVRAKGRFSKSTPGGSSIVKSRGFLVIDDETGRIVGEGSLEEIPPATRTPENVGSPGFWQYPGE